MQRNLRDVLPLAALALAACHVRAIPFSTPPGFSVSKEAREGELGRKQDVTLSDEENHYIAAFRYDLPAPGGLTATAKPVNPQAQITVAIFSEGSGNEPIATWLVLTLPFIIYGFLGFTKSALTGRPQRRLFIPPIYLWAWLVLLIAFWIFRNTPWYPFVS